MEEDAGLNKTEQNERKVTRHEQGSVCGEIRGKGKDKSEIRKEEVLGEVLALLAEFLKDPLTGVLIGFLAGAGVVLAIADQISVEAGSPVWCCWAACLGTCVPVVLAQLGTVHWCSAVAYVATVVVMTLVFRSAERRDPGRTRDGGTG